MRFFFSFLAITAPLGFLFSFSEDPYDFDDCSDHLVEREYFSLLYTHCVENEEQE